LLLANRILHLIDGRTERSYGATCGDLTCGPGEGVSFLEDIRDLFMAVRSGIRDLPMTGAVPFVLPTFHTDHYRAAEIIAVIEKMRNQPDAWILLGMHGVGAGTHNNFIRTSEHSNLIDWITEQGTWLEAVNVLEAVHRRPA
jgi:hypothetical protein